MSETVSTKAEKVAALKQKIAGVKQLIGKPVQEGVKRVGNPNWAAAGVKTRWQKGQSGNPSGGKKTNVSFWKYVVAFLEMTQETAELIPDNELTMAQLGARTFAVNVSKGKWIMTKEIMDRELGRPREGLGEGDEEEPTLVKLPFKVAG